MLATGIVVDDAIVVIENIERHLQEDKKPPLQAASDAMREVFGAVAKPFESTERLLVTIRTGG